MKLARPKKDDVLFDLGCGYGQNLLVAASEFNLKCVGIEKVKARCKQASATVKQWEKRERIQPDQIRIKCDTMENLIDGNIENVNLNDATIIFFGLKPTIPLDFKPKKRMFIESVKGLLNDNCRVIAFFTNGIFPEIKPVDVAFPFYLYKTPLDKYTPKNKLDWLQSVIKRENRTPTHTEKELWDELTNDLNVDNFLPEEARLIVRDYKKRVAKASQERVI